MLTAWVVTNKIVKRAVKVVFKVDNPWFSGQASVTTFHLEELLGTKLRVLYQRRKGRDLFDLHHAIQDFESIDVATLTSCFSEYCFGSSSCKSIFGLSSKFEAKKSTLQTHFIARGFDLKGSP